MTTTGYLTLLSDLLTSDDVVCIPGFGGFLTKYKSASIDPVNGILDPPTKYIAFNPSLQDDGGRLMAFFQSRPEVDIDAKRMERFVQELKADLATHQVIVVPKIGRLYQDYDDQVHFMPNLDNLNNQAFALPRLRYTPRLRTQPVIQEEPLKIPQTAGRDHSALRAVLSTAAVFLVGAVGYFALQQGGQNDSSVHADATTEMSVIDQLIDSPSTTIDQPTTAEFVAPANANEAPIVDVRTSIIMIGAFGDADNVRRLVQKIEAAEYLPYVDQRGRLQRVGIEVSYADDAGLNAYLRDIRAQYTPSAWILE